MPRKTKPKEQKVYVPPKFKVQVSSLLDIESEITDMFNDILADYCSRFDTKVIPEKVDTQIILCLVQGGSDPTDMDGLCVFDQRNKLKRLLMQIRCMVIEGIEPNMFSVQHWSEIICHEIVHACQELTGRKMDPIKMIPQGWQSENYYFDPDEVEARLLQAPYANRVSKEAMLSILNKINECFEDEDDEQITTLKLLYEEADIRH